MKAKEINVAGRKAYCIFHKVKNPAAEDLIILPGAGTIYRSYIPLLTFMHRFNTIIIHTPLHGSRRSLSDGPAIENGAELAAFETEAVKTLVSSSLCSKKVNLLGYSLGGMSLFRILLNGSLSAFIKKAVFLNTAFYTEKDSEYFIDLSERNIFFSTAVSSGKILKGIGSIIKSLCQNVIVASKEAYAADAKCVAAFNGSKEDIPFSITTPSLYIGTKRDNIFPAETVKASFKHFTDCRLEILDGDHKAYAYRPISYARAINSFLLD